MTAGQAQPPNGPSDDPPTAASSPAGIAASMGSRSRLMISIEDPPSPLQHMNVNGLYDSSIPNTPSPKGFASHTKAETPRTRKQRFRKFITTKFVDTRLGRSKIESRLGAFEERLLGLLNDFAEEAKSKSFAVNLKKNIFKVAIKTALFVDEGRIDPRELDQLSEPVNGVVEELQKQTISIPRAQALMAQIRDILVHALAPHVTGNTLSRIKDIHEFMQCEKTLTLLGRTNSPIFMDIKSQLITTLIPVKLSPGFASNYLERERQDRESEALDLKLQEEKWKDRLNLKVLLLGAGECGKSTLMSQLRRIARKQQLTEPESQFYKQVLHANCLEAMKALLGQFVQESDSSSSRPKTRRDLTVTLRNEKLHSAAKHLYLLDCHHTLQEKDALYINRIWLDDEVQEAYFCSDLYIPDSASYYFQHALRFASDDFVPTEVDVNFARIRTTGVRTEKLSFGPLTYSFVDVGGQRNERRKWIDLFDNMDAVFYVVNLAGYRKRCFEDNTQNRLLESLELFSSTLNHQAFAGKPVFLVFNKKDLFREQMKKETSTNGAGIAAVFPDYKGRNELEPAARFLMNKFRDRLPEGRKICGVIVISAVVRAEVQESSKVLFDFLCAENDKVIRESCRCLGKKYEPPTADFSQFVLK